MVTDNKELKEWRQKLIDEQHNGNEAEFDSEINDGYAELIAWDQIMDSINILPDLELEAHALIVTMLGFLPEPYMTIPQEPFLRALISSYKSGMLNDQEFYEQTEQCIIPMRNEWIRERHTCIGYNRQADVDYASLIPEFRDKVRSRLTRFLGYEPSLATSISVEVNLNNTMFKDIRKWPDHITPADLQAILVIKYREVLLAEGKDAADKSALPTAEIEYRQKMLINNF